MFEAVGGTEAAVVLGDAFVNIHEHDKAISVYETALKRNPKDRYLRVYWA
jgi:predicted negative regulator of RcsB-dependent stress response